MMRRRQVLGGMSAGALAAALPSCDTRPPLPPGRIVGQAHAFGHLVRDGFKAAPVRELRTQVAVIGAGVSGLSAARALRQQGIEDLHILELSDQPGGNASCGVNEVSPYPWGAHYLPLPGPELVDLRAWLREIGVIIGTDANGEPVYEETCLCRDPQERLFELGAWHEGLTPNVGITDEDRAQFTRFGERVKQLQSLVGSDGKRAFALPVNDSSRDYRDLDLLTMSAWLHREGFTSSALHWLVNYACCDDYGSRMEQTSAWAGLHYFAARTGSEEGDVLTWPEGNGWLVRQLAQPFVEQLHLNTLVLRITQTKAEALIDCFDVKSQEAWRLRTAAVVFAGPRFVAARVVAGCPAPAHDYVPWLTANLTVRPLQELEPMEMHWDNVLHRSPGLGYVNAMHQQLGQHFSKSVLTYYRPLTDDDSKAAREAALRRTHEQWADLVLADLEQAHPDIREKTERLDVWLWGHAMVRLSPGFLWTQRQQLPDRTGRVVYAHTDMSGISIFEEAFHQGRRAAQAVKELLVT